MDLIVVIIIAISLSMDAFSLSLAYGTLGMNRRQMNFLSLVVGLFHFFMPLLGMIVGEKIFSLFNFNPDFIVFLILFIIGIQMILDSFKENNELKLMKIPQYFLFAFAVSLDSFSIGITLTQIYKNYFVSVIVFSLASYSFTRLGLLLGNIIKKSIGKYSTLIGGVILILIGILLSF